MLNNFDGLRATDKLTFLDDDLIEAGVGEVAGSVEVVEVVQGGEAAPQTTAATSQKRKADERDVDSDEEQERRLKVRKESLYISSFSFYSYLFSRNSGRD